MTHVPFSDEFQRQRAIASLGASFAVTVLLIAVFISPGANAQTTGVLSGRVTNTQGSPLTVLVRLFAQGDIPAGSAYSDSNGSYVFMGLPSDVYTVAVDADGYNPFRASVRLEDNIQPRAQVMVVLEPAERQPASKTASSPDDQFNRKRPSPQLHGSKAIKEYEKGIRAEREGKNDAAVAHYQKAFRMDATFYPALNNMGTIYERQGKHAQANEAFLQALKINPNDGESYINLGHVLYQQGQYGPAIERLRQGLQRSPESPAGNFLLGSAYYQTHDTEKAEALLKKACALDPFHMAPARLQLANLYLQRHDYESAKLQLQIYLQIDPKSPQTAAVKNTLKELERQ